MILTLLLVAIYAVHAVLCVWSLIQIRQFLATTPTIADESCLQRYKSLVRVQMYLALVGIGVLISGVVIGMVLTLRYGCMGLLIVIVGSAWLLGFGIFMKRWEGRVRSLPAGSEGLAQEYRRVSETWIKRAFPDF
jgi:uncharacterized membrane protein